jgi:hypothetical protein
MPKDASCIQILKCRVFLLLKMHKNVNIKNKMLFLVFYRVIKAAIIAEKNFITWVMKNFSAMMAAFIVGYENFFCNDGCLYHPIKHQRKHFII